MTSLRSRHPILVLLLWAARVQASPPALPTPADPVGLGLIARDSGRDRVLVLVEVSRASCPATVTLTPELARRARVDPHRRHAYLELGAWDGPRARALNIAAVPAFFAYRSGELVARGAAALRAFRQDSAQGLAGTHGPLPGGG